MNAAGTSGNICAETVPPDPFRILTARHPHLAPHIRKLKVAVACGDLGTAARLLEGLEIAVEATTGNDIG